MTRYLFITWDGSGNQTPTLCVAQDLREHGYDVAFAGYASQQARIAAHGFRFSVLERSNAVFHLFANGDMLAAMAAGVWVTPAHFDDVRDAAAARGLSAARMAAHYRLCASWKSASSVKLPGRQRRAESRQSAGRVSFFL